MNDFQLNLPKRNPLLSLDCTLRCDVMIPSNLFGLCPRPCNVHFLEVQIRALCTQSTQSARIGLNTKQRVFGAPSTRDADQNMLARFHQIEPLTMSVAATGDPHLQNVHGERFDLMKS